MDFLHCMISCIPNLPGHAVFAIYGSKHNDSTVKFSTGLSYHYSSKKAIEKSVLELWQIYHTMHEAILSGTDVNDIKDLYHKHFWSSNNIESYYKLTEENSLSKISLKNYLLKDDASQKSLYDWIKSLTKNFYIYVATESLGSINLRYVRAFSPDFFIHMDCSRNLNHNNAISKEFPYIFKDRQNSLVLFP